MGAPIKGTDWIRYGVTMPDTAALRGMRILVVGGGPCGLTAAIMAKNYGADVTLYEKTGDPLKGKTGYTLRSFNFTLNDVGRAELGNSRAWAGGTTLVGRAAHHEDTVKYAPFTGGKDGLLTSIPRNTFRRNLARWAADLIAHQHYGTPVTRIDPQTASIWTSHTGSQPITGDLIIVADGLHSTIDGHLATTIRKATEPYRYITATVPLGGLSPKHIHFWHQEGTESYTVGIPNRGSSITLLLFSLFTDTTNIEHPFATPQKSVERLKKEFPKIYALAPHIANKLSECPVGSFHYKESDRVALGPRMVALGDAIGARPPWAGFGTNVALHSAGALLRCITAYGQNLEAALSHFEAYQLTLARLVREYTENHGKFLSRRVASHPGENSRDALAGLIQIAQENLAAPTTV